MGAEGGGGARMRKQHTSAETPLTDLLFEEAGVGLCLVAPDGIVVRANAEWLRSTGLALDDVLGANIIELSPDMRELALALHARARAGQRVELPRRAQHIAGRETWWEGSISPVPMHGGTGLLVTVRDVTTAVIARDAAGGRSDPDTGSAVPLRLASGDLGTCGTAVDVTERNRAEEALRRSEERARAVSKNMRDHLVVLEAIRAAAGEVVDWRYVDANDAALELLDTTRDRLIGATLREVLGHRGAARHEQLVRVLATGERVRYESEFRDRALLVTLFRVDANTVGSAAFDITDLRRGELALRASEARYRMLFDSIDEGFCIIEVVFDERGKPIDYRFVEVNRAFEKQTGLVDAAGKLMRQLAPQHEEHWFQIYGRVAVTGEPIRFENRAEALGRTFDVYAFRVGKPESRRVAILFNDISDRKRAEAALREADQRKSEFLGVLSHELRNPLAPIRNSIVLLDRAPAGSAQARRAREIIHRQTEHLTRLVDDLLDVTRISRDKIELQRTRLEVRDVVRKTCDDNHALLEQSGIEMHLDLPLSPVWIDGDATRISQVLGNLLHNAAKFTPAGGRVVVSVASRDGWVEIRVTDSGGGIDPDELERMFEPFAQGEQDLARTAGGLGLGLALVKGLVELHGGTVRAHSEGRGRGCEFLVSLPAAAGGQGVRSPQRVTAGTTKRQVLVIEDNLDSGQSLADVLELGGHRAQVARDGRTGIEMARRLKPDVVLCDIGLPDMSGYDVARALRADDALRSTRLIALTGYAQPEDRRRALEAGFEAHMPKPVSLDELGELLDRER